MLIHNSASKTRGTSKITTKKRITVTHNLGRLTPYPLNTEKACKLSSCVVFADVTVRGASKTAHCSLHDTHRGWNCSHAYRAFSGYLYFVHDRSKQLHNATFAINNNKNNGFHNSRHFSQAIDKPAAAVRKSKTFLERTFELFQKTL